jgi:hypothetical protein
MRTRDNAGAESPEEAEKYQEENHEVLPRTNDWKPPHRGKVEEAWGTAEGDESKPQGRPSSETDLEDLKRGVVALKKLADLEYAKCDEESSLGRIHEQGSGIQRPV